MYPEIKVSIFRTGKHGYQVARDLGWSASKLSQIISGIHTPSSEEKKLLAEYFSRPVSELFSTKNQETAHA